MELSNLKALLNTLVGQLSPLRVSIAEFRRVLNIQAVTPNQISSRNSQVLAATRKLYDQVTGIKNIYLSPEELILLNNNNFGETFGKDTENKLLAALNNPGVLNEKAVNERLFIIENYIDQIVGADKVITAFNVQPEILTDGNYDYIDIVFENKTEVDNFSSAREQIEDWYFIFYGYALLLNKSVEDFEIVTIQKNSPVRIRIKVDFEAGKTIRNFATGLIVIATAFVQRDLLFANLEKLAHGSDLNNQKNEYIEKAKKQAERELKLQIEELVNATISSKGFTGRGDINNALNTSAKKQYNFYIHGGNVNFQIGEGDNHLDVKENNQNYQLAKDSLQQTLNQAEELKVLPVKASFQDSIGN